MVASSGNLLDTAVGVRRLPVQLEIVVGRQRDKDVPDRNKVPIDRPVLTHNRHTPTRVGNVGAVLLEPHPDILILRVGVGQLDAELGIVRPRVGDLYLRATDQRHAVADVRGVQRDKLLRVDCASGLVGRVGKRPVVVLEPPADLRPRTTRVDVGNTGIRRHPHAALGRRSRSLGLCARLHMDRRIRVMRVEGRTRKVVVGPHNVRVNQPRANVDRGRERFDRVAREGDGHGLRLRWDRPRRRIERVNHRIHVIPQLLAIRYPLGPLLGCQRHVGQLRVIAGL